MSQVVRFAAVAAIFVLSPLAAGIAAEQSGQTAAGTQSQAPVRAPGTTVLVTAQKEPADPAKLPVSVTALSDDVIKSAGITFVSDAGMFSPNTHFTEFSARKLSNPRIRGIGASPANPGVTTYVDGVPQLNSNTSSFDLVGVSQIEFVRGPQSALFGRNALGGLINISSSRPSLSKWGGNVAVPFGSNDLFDVRADVSGPISTDKLAVGFSMAFSKRDGFTENTLNPSFVTKASDKAIDSREGFSGKGQLLWTPNAAWETRVIISGERARDGDYALNDLAAVRANPFEVARDFEGFTNRDIFSTTALVRREGKGISFASTTGILSWNTLDSTDLDYTPFPLSTRENKEEAVQFTQEVRFSSTAAAPIKVSGTSALRWQAGAVFFTQNYDQNAVNTIAPFVLSPQIPFTVMQTSPNAALDDVGVGMYGQGTLAFNDKFDLSFGLRFDYENRKADLLTSFDPPIGAPPIVVNEERDFSDVSPQIAAAFRLKGQTMLYGTFSRAYKTGGFNPVSLPGSESYDEEHAWNIEGGIKSTVANGHVGLTASVFSIDWDDLQLNLPLGPGQFYIANIGGATSRGAEFEVTTRVYEGIDVFGALGFARARFADGTSSQGVDVSDKTIPNTPAYTASFGAQYTRALGAGGRLYGRGEVAVVGKFHYDEANTEHQDDYAITNFRAGWKRKMLIVEGWVRNAFDTSYVPLAFAFPGGLQPSGFLAEPGRPRTAGISIGIGF